MNRHGLLLLIMLSGLWACPGPARADTTCTVQSATLAFGTASSSSNTDSNVSFSITCNTFGLALLATARVSLCLSLGDGSGGVGSFTPRLMSSTTGHTTQYQLYRDAARTQIWGALGNATIPTPLTLQIGYPVPALGGSQSQSVTLYGRIPATQSFSVGSYSSSFTGAATTLNYAYNESTIGNTTYPTNCTTAISGAKTATSAFPLTVTANVAPHCDTYVTGDLNFGQVTSARIANAIAGTTDIGLTCTNLTAWNIGLDNGQNANGNVRRMRLGSNYVTYELYRDSAYSSRWGNTIGTDTASGTGTGGAQTVRVYGQVPVQNPAAGSYSDVITVTITY
jgi:spore coat protein U-like protein